VLVYAVVDDSVSPTSPLGDAIKTFIGREDAERFVDVRGDDPELASPCGSRSASWWPAGSPTQTQTAHH
jgi:hypothetical protein